MTLRVGAPKVSYHPTKFGVHRHCGSGGMFLLFHVILQDHVAKFGGHRHCGSGNIMVLVLSRDFFRPRHQRVMWFYGWEYLMVSHHPAKFVDHRNCGRRDVFLVVQAKDSTCPCLNPPLLFISKAHDIPCSLAGVSNEGYPILITHASLTTDGNYIKKFLPVRPETVTRRERRRKKTKARTVIEKFFACANAISSKSKQIHLTGWTRVSGQPFPLKMIHNCFKTWTKNIRKIYLSPLHNE